MAIRLTSATFEFAVDGDNHSVIFYEDSVAILDSDWVPILPVSNIDRKYKPCATHAKELLNRALGTGKKESNHARKRRQRSAGEQPKLGIYTEE